MQQIQFRHATSSAWLLNDLTLELDHGDVAMIIGDNGSGKSTLGRLIAGLHKPQSGSVEINGIRIGECPIPSRPTHAVYMGQTSYLQFFRSSIDDEVRFAARLSGRSLDEAYSTYRAFALPEDRGTKPMDLPYPTMWRFQLFLFSAVFDPAVLYVDEIVAPGARAQMDALEAVIESRSRRKQVTIIAYQRGLARPGLRRFELIDGRLREY